MKIIDLEDLKNYNQQSAVCIGFFDGFHKGHQMIIQHLLSASKEHHLKSVVITFSDDAFSSLKKSVYILNLSQRLKILQEYDVDYVLVLNGNDQVIDLSALDFKKKYLDPLHIHTFVCGEDICFGKNKSGDLIFLKEQCQYNLCIVDKYLYEQQVLSSSFLRKLIQNKQIKQANELLYTPFYFQSIVKKGKQIGRTIDYKTINLTITPSCELLAHGVYVGLVHVHQQIYKAMINVGYNPTVSDDFSLKVEAHLLDFNENLYEQEVLVEFIDFIRDEKKFSSLKELKNQLDQDLNFVLKYSFNKS